MPGIARPQRVQGGGEVRWALALASVFLCAAPAAGQALDDGAPPAAERQVQLIEQGLEQAVRRGVDAVEQRLPAPVPGLIVFAGTVRARGFVLDGYGLFFDVEFPVVRRSMLWSIRAIGQRDGAVAQSLANLRRRVLEMPQGAGRSALERAIRELEGLTRPRAAREDTRSGPQDAPSGRIAPPALLGAAELEEFYRAALQGELADALIAYGGALPPGALADGDWLTVAARDGRGRPAGERRTLQLRIRGGHLSALRDGRLSAEDTRAHIEIR